MIRHDRSVVKLRADSVARAIHSLFQRKFAPKYKFIFLTFGGGVGMNFTTMKKALVETFEGNIT